MCSIYNLKCRWALSEEVISCHLNRLKGDPHNKQTNSNKKINLKFQETPLFIVIINKELKNPIEYIQETQHKYICKFARWWHRQKELGVEKGVYLLLGDKMWLWAI